MHKYLLSTKVATDIFMAASASTGERLGQAIMNRLPFITYHHFSGTDDDLFYLTDDDLSTKLFWSKYVNFE